MEIALMDKDGRFVVDWTQVDANFGPPFPPGEYWLAMRGNGETAPAMIGWQGTPGELPASLTANMEVQP
jgi:hypothetical protein